MRGGGFSCFPCSPLRVPYLWASIGSSLVLKKLLLLIKKKKKKDFQFLDKIPFYTKTSLQGENLNED